MKTLFPLKDGVPFETGHGPEVLAGEIAEPDPGVSVGYTHGGNWYRRSDGAQMSRSVRTGKVVTVQQAIRDQRRAREGT